MLTITDGWDLTPHAVEGWWWIQFSRWVEPGRIIDRYGTVSWNRDGTGHYSVSLTFEQAGGLGLYCWPDFRALSDAQAFVEELIDRPLDEVKKLHGRQWPGVVL